MVAPVLSFQTVCGKLNGCCHNEYAVKLVPQQAPDVYHSVQQSVTCGELPVDVEKWVANRGRFRINAFAL